MAKCFGPLLFNSIRWVQLCDKTNLIPGSGCQLVLKNVIKLAKGSLNNIFQDSFNKVLSQQSILSVSSSSGLLLSRFVIDVIFVITMIVTIIIIIILSSLLSSTIPLSSLQSPSQSSLSISSSSSSLSATMSLSPYYNDDYHGFRHHCQHCSCRQFQHFYLIHFYVVLSQLDYYHPYSKGIFKVGGFKSNTRTGSN